MDAQSIAEHSIMIGQVRRRFVTTAAILCLCVGTIFFILGLFIEFLQMDTLAAFINLAVAGLGLTLLILLRFPKLLSVASYLLIMGIFVLSLLMISDKPQYNMYYIFALPTMYIFILGKTAGAIVSVFYILACATLLFTTSKLSLHPFTLLQIMSSMTYITILMYFHQKIIDTSGLFINEQNIKLRQTVEELQASQKKLEGANNELRKTNDLMVGRELRMHALKQEIETLKTPQVPPPPAGGKTQSG